MFVLYKPYLTSDIMWLAVVITHKNVQDYFISPILKCNLNNYSFIQEAPVLLIWSPAELSL